MTPKEFFDTHDLGDIDSDDNQWADMETFWMRGRPDSVALVATVPGVLNDCELRKFSVFSVRLIQHKITGPRISENLDAAWAFAEGRLHPERFEIARDSARSWARCAPHSEKYPAWFYAMVFERSALDAAKETMWVATSRTMRAMQVQWLRENTKPNFQ